MRECHKDILVKLFLALLKDLEPRPLLLHLFSKREINEYDMDEIQSCNSRTTMSEELILKLMKKGPQAFSNLVDGLQNTQPFLACSLLQEENKRLSELEIELENLKMEREKLKTKLQCFEENERLRPLSSLESPKDDFEEPFDDSSGRQSGRVECKRTSRCQKSRTSTRLRNEASQRKEYHFRYEGDFDTKGVIHYLGFNAGVNMWRNPARVEASGVKVTYCDKNGRGDPENILEYFHPANSSTRSGWCLDLGDCYTLRLTDYTVRQVGSNDRNFLQNFEILGSLCDDDWCVLDRQHEVDWRSQRFSNMTLGNRSLLYKTKTWSVKGKVRAYRKFKIVRMKDRSTSVPGANRMSLAGIELYGVLSVP
ncbi:uncharacterized protein LOC122959524 isoform X3 [Acropora millepora]|uniref:uncharacterized protein LOC122959524 isoform X3 n=1 Tax=Acropora millepora TaxID=45264 RepID=UPI001CF579F0|nr:uncharacterized protein LOC122959524 isoform X3 [Acropora millepora]